MSRRYGVWALLVVLALVPFFVIGGPGAGWLRDLGIVDRDERFTELSFPDRSGLPASVTVGAPISFDVEIRNREGEATSYRWKAVVTTGPRDEASDLELARGGVRLDDGEARRIPVVGPAPGLAGPGIVRVSLVGRDEAIDFRLAIVAVADDPTAPTG